MALYTPTVPSASGQPSNENLNALSDHYALAFSKSTTPLIQRAVKKIIYDSAPQQYADLMILDEGGWEEQDTDVVNYHEMGWGRNAILSDTIAAPIAGGASQVIPVQNIEDISVNSIVVLDSNQKATVTAISGSNMTITAMTGETLPLIGISAAGDHSFAFMSPVEADGIDGVSSYFRQYTTERTNYIQLLSSAMRFGGLELKKYTKAGTTSNYLSMQRAKWLEQYRVHMSNIYWNGQRGEVTITINGTTMKAKTTDGIFPIMTAASSANATVTLSEAPETLELLALATEYKQYGYRRFVYAAPKVIHYLTQQYKGELVRYTQNERLAILGLDGIKMGSSELIFVPMKRFEDPSCFPSSFANRLFCLDQASIKPWSVIPEKMYRTLNRAGGVLKSYVDEVIEGSIGVEFNNPLGCFYMNISDLPTL